MPSLAIRLQEIGDTQLEEFVEIWIERRSQQYVRVERIGAANDKGRDVVGFLSERGHQGPWDLFQCKRKTRGGKLGTPEAITELGKLFHHHVSGAYRTLPVAYVFVAPRGIVGSLRDLILNPSTLGPYLIDHWDEHCSRRISDGKVTPLSPELRAAIDAFDFARISYLTAPMIVKDPAAAPALSKVLELIPGEAPPGTTPDAIQLEELAYVDQLRQVYSEASGAAFSSADDVFAHPDHEEDQSAGGGERARVV
jgi:hypothetical protein